MKRPAAMQAHIARYTARISDPVLRERYEKAYAHTWDTALFPMEDGTYFILTGDIPAMWLRDSSAQVHHYVGISDDPEIARVIEGVLSRQLMYIQIDPYANAFNQNSNGVGHVNDRPKQGPWVFERKYEIDSLCYPIRLLYHYYKTGNGDGFVREKLPPVARVILDVWKTEQKHAEQSPYRFIRPDPNAPWDTIYNDGLGAPVAETGMTWCGFRPSDDGCEYGYLTASEMFATVVLEYMAEMLEAVCNDPATAAECRKLRDEIDAGIRAHCTAEHPTYGQIYVCETDGFGNKSFLDDANVPSLLSIPYIGYAGADDPIYQNTRRFLLGKENPFYFEGKYAKGIGSRHTPEGYIWHMSLAIQGLTSKDAEEKRTLLRMLLATDAGTGYLHEGFDANDPTKYTREWFTWPNALFAEFVEKCVDEGTVS